MSSACSAYGSEPAGPPGSGRLDFPVIDAHILEFFLDARTARLTPVVAVFSELTRPAFVLLYAVLAAGVAIVPRRPSDGRWLVLPAAVLAANLASAVLKRVIGRERPPLELQLVQEINPALPSGHATGVAAAALALTLLLSGRARLMAVAAWAVALATGLSRLYLGVHWPSDVLAGWGLGAGVAFLVWSLFSCARSQSHVR